MQTSESQRNLTLRIKWLCVASFLSTMSRFVFPVAWMLHQIKQTRARTSTSQDWTWGIVASFLLARLLLFVVCEIANVVVKKPRSNALLFCARWEPFLQNFAQLLLVFFSLHLLARVSKGVTVNTFVHNSDTTFAVTSGIIILYMQLCITFSPAISWINLGHWICVLTSFIISLGSKFDKDHDFLAANDKNGVICEGSCVATGIIQAIAISLLATSFEPALTRIILVWNVENTIEAGKIYRTKMLLVALLYVGAVFVFSLFFKSFDNMLFEVEKLGTVPTNRVLWFFVFVSTAAFLTPSVDKEDNKILQHTAMYALALCAAHVVHTLTMDVVWPCLAVAMLLFVSKVASCTLTPIA
jgi:hypothetical protein